MRIAIVTQEDPFYLPAALDALCKAENGHICAMIVLAPFNERMTDTGRRLYEFYGPRDFSRLVFRYARARCCNAVNKIRPITRPCSPGDVAERYGVPVFRPKNINSSVFLEALREEIRPELIVSVAASQIFRKRVLEVPPMGCINLHSAPLPRYQGMMPNFWVMLNGEPHGTVTVHEMVEAVDAGDVIIQRPVPIFQQDSLHKVMVRSKEVGVQALLDAISLIREGRAPRKPMVRENSTYFSFPKRADANRFRAMGWSLL